MKVVELVILNASIFLNQHGQLFELCSQNPTINENGSCRSRDSEHISLSMFWSTSVNFLKFVHKILL